MFGRTSSSSEISLFTAAVVVEDWSDALHQDHCKQLCGDWEEKVAAMVRAYLLVAFVLPSRDNGSPSSVISGRSLHTSFDYVCQPVNVTAGQVRNNSS